MDLLLFRQLQMACQGIEVIYVRFEGGPLA